MFLSVSYTKKQEHVNCLIFRILDVFCFGDDQNVFHFQNTKTQQTKYTKYSDASHFQNSQKVDRIQIGFVSEIGSGRSLFRVVFSGFMFIFDQWLFFF